MNLLDPANRFNVANLITFANIACGVVSLYLIPQHLFVPAIVLAWIAGALDIADGKVARRYNLSTEFGIQLDSFADFLSFVVMPAFLLFYAVKHYMGIGGLEEAVLGGVLIVYIVAGLRRHVEFNLKVDAGEVAKYFDGVPTPLGAILLWVLYLLSAYGVLTSGYVVAVGVAIIAWSLNSHLKIPHP